MDKLEWTADGGHGVEGLHAPSRVLDGAYYTIGRGEYDGLFVPMVFRPDPLHPKQELVESLGALETLDEAKDAAQECERDMPNLAGLCTGDDEPILKIGGKWQHINFIDFEDENDHEITPRPGSVTTADVWDVDDAIAGRYTTPGGAPETPASPPPWAVLYRTPTGRPVYIVHNGTEDDGYRPINGDGGTVRVEYVADDGSQIDARYAEFGWEHPDGLTVTEPATGGEL